MLLIREGRRQLKLESPAYAAFEENDKGKIDIGMLADFTVLSADIMKISAPDILKTRCEMTIVGGKIVYETR